MLLTVFQKLRTHSITNNIKTKLNVCKQSYKKIDCYHTFVFYM